MKKFVTIITCMLLTLSMALAIGCGGSSTFKGNYEEVTKDEAKAFIATVELKENTEELEVTKGLKLDFKFDVDYSKDNKSIKINSSTDFKTALVDGKVQMASKSDVEFNAKGMSDEEAEEMAKLMAGAKMEMYLADNKYYIKSGDVKKYVPVEIDEIDDTIEDSLEDVYDSVIDLDEVIKVLELQGLTIKYSIDNDKDASKIKFEGTLEKNGNSMETTIIFVYDKGYNLVAYQMESVVKGEIMGNGTGEINTKLSIEPYSGKIKLPNDLDTYKKATTLDSIINGILW